MTVGEMSGIGPELSLRLLRDPAITRAADLRLYGPQAAIYHLANTLGWAAPADEQLVDCGEIDLQHLRAGQFDAMTGAASHAAVIAAIDDAVAGLVDAIVTGPIQKEAWHAAGIPTRGHTELLAQRSGAASHAMMLASPALACVLVTTHIPLAFVPQQLRSDEILRVIHLAHDHAARFRVAGERPPRVGVCGLNPHAGEHGLMSCGEEEQIIAPAIQAARECGLHVDGPLSPDTAFTAASRALFDIHVCMYHDQGLIPLKTLDFDRGINVTLGLPIIRTSVDHGTAMDLAWQGAADATSMKAATQMAIEMARREAGHSG
ncbi:MAG: 4-hydroxythreonine-4-phosphate dehydrogenase PdxA [Planctomycetota bacterium]